ncbi:hypothetical protein VTH82DRAFT_1117 [Thermothelomyces myriococcoides]
MEWPLTASFDRPDQLVKSGELGAKYETAGADAMNTFKIHGNQGDDFFLSWGPDSHNGKLGYSEHNEDDSEKDKNKQKKKNHKGKTETRTLVSNRHGKLQGHYNNKKFFSCWVFEKHLHSSLQVTPEKKKSRFKWGKKDEKKDDKKDSMVPVVPYIPPSWSNCEPHIPLWVRCEEAFHDKSRSSEKEEDCGGASCGLDKCREATRQHKQEVSKSCQGDSCADKQEISKGCDRSGCGGDEDACGDDSCSDSDDGSTDDGSDDDSDDESGSDDCDGGSCDGKDGHECNC